MKNRLFFSFHFFIKVALATVLPIAVFVYPGYLLDNKFEILPKLTLIGAFLAIAFTFLLIRLLARQASCKIQQLDK